MYTIIGGDGKEYGPVPADQVRAWIFAGRANLDTQVKALGTQEWKRVRDVPELGETPAVPPSFAPRDPAVQALADPELAGRWIRLGARLLDGVFSTVFMGPGLVMLIPWFVAHSNDDAGQNLLSHSPFSSFSSDVYATMPTAAVTLLFAGWFAVAVTQILLLSLRGQTVGKIVAGVRIVRLDGQQAGFFHAWFLRTFVVGMISFIPYAGLVFALADILFIFSASRRCLHDLIAGTVVVKA
jgi:uncharacterized RDD family membrane protein YckC